MSEYVKVGGLSVDTALYDLVAELSGPYLPQSNETLWEAFADLCEDLGPQNEALLAKRAQLQAAIDDWHRHHGGTENDAGTHAAFLRDIGYLLDEGPDFRIETTNIDDEIATVAGPQLVVPVSNIRFALNAANARWRSLYDALYGSDVIPSGPGLETGAAYNAARGEKVVAFTMEFLDRAAPLEGARHGDVAQYFLVRDGGASRWQLRALLRDQSSVSLIAPNQFQGYLGDEEAPSTILLRNNGLHIEIHVDRRHPVGQASPSGVKDVVLEAALTTIQDFEDSVAAVDAEDKVAAYRNWAGLIDGSLEAQFIKGGQRVHRRLDQDRIYIAADGNALTLKGRSLMLVRNVGLLTTTGCVLDRDGNEIPEGFLDAFVTALCALPDLKGRGGLRNSRTGSLYIVKPKLHGPEESALTARLLARVEGLLGIEENTIKVGLMDEERRTSLNLKECVRALKRRIVFINTGFLDRTGDEIRTNMEAGPVLPKEEIKSEPWLLAYEKRNVAIGLACGFRGRAQIGKGMWPKPDEMAEMVASKQVHLQAGANCAWVPSPTAAALHAMHYHETNVAAVQTSLETSAIPPVEDLLRMPLLRGRSLSDDEIRAELNNNLQGILGYVVRWVDQGVGCSKVPDIHNVALMEDRATLRISSQHVANWLRHGICSEEQVRGALEEMARIVDGQNTGDPNYRPMAPNFADSAAFAAASALVFEGPSQPNGYTELILHEARRRVKAGN